MEWTALVLKSHKINRDFWIWPNLVSLDAALVAVFWQIVLANGIGVRLNPFEPFVLALAVWLVYLTDHLMDTRRRDSGQWEPARKVFCRRYWGRFFGLAVVVGLGLLACANRLLWIATLRGGLALSTGVIGYFSLIHFTPAGSRIRWPREVAVALLFACGTFGAIWLGNGRNLVPLLAPALIFTLLCWANCSLIETWEWRASGSADLEAPNGAARWAEEHLTAVGAGIAVLSGLFGLSALQPGGFAAAGCLSGAGLAVLGVGRRRVPIHLVSPAADLALCSPLVVLAYGWLR